MKKSVNPQASENLSQKKSSPQSPASSGASSEKAAAAPSRKTGSPSNLDLANLDVANSDSANSHSGSEAGATPGVKSQDASQTMKNRTLNSTSSKVKPEALDSAGAMVADAATGIDSSGDNADLPRSLEDAVYSEMTRNIRVSVQPEYLADQSEPGRASSALQYTVTIENLGSESVQLLSRHWRINSGGAEYMQVKGDGVVGEQPTLQTSHGFRYTSGTVIKDPVGSMCGSYTFRSATGEMFDVEIPRFDLIYPHLLH